MALCRQTDTHLGSVSLRIQTYRQPHPPWECLCTDRQTDRQADKQTDMAAYLGKAALLVNERDDIERLDCQQVEDFLVVLKLDVLPANVLLVVLLLLQLEDVVDKELLQVLIAEIDAQLLEGVLLEGLKAEDV